MNRTVNAIFENGVFRPTEPVALSDGSHVELTVRTDETAAPLNGSAAEVLSRLAALPIEGKADAFSGGDHDAILYGRDGAR
ncbi:MAG: antitoxin family protein [Planctomycetota bacterium]|nr:antitoxin family protein [Planctomycetota bacterium]